MNPCGLRAWSFFNDTFALSADGATCGAAGAAPGGASRYGAGQYLYAEPGQPWKLDQLPSHPACTAI